MDLAREREQQILAYMRKRIKEKGYPPTVREICSDLGIKSTSTVHKDIGNLVKQGYIKKDPSKPRALVLVDEPFEKSDDIRDTADVAEREDVIDVPVVGKIAAGTPITAQENLEDTFPVPARFVGGDNTFMLVVRGESMIEAGIMDGDYILVRQQETANNGDIVVAMIDGFESEATVKTFYRENGHIRLQPENPQMNPIIVNDAKILGKVTGVFRYFN